MTERSSTHVSRNADPLCSGQAISGTLVPLRIEIDSPDDIDRGPAGSTDAGCSGLSRLAAIVASSACCPGATSGARTNAAGAHRRGIAISIGRRCGHDASARQGGIACRAGCRRAADATGSSAASARCPSASTAGTGTATGSGATASSTATATAAAAVATTVAAAVPTASSAAAAFTGAIGRQRNDRSDRLCVQAACRRRHLAEDRCWQKSEHGEGRAKRCGDEEAYGHGGTPQRDAAGGTLEMPWKRL